MTDRTIKGQSSTPGENLDVLETERESTTFGAVGENGSKSRRGAGLGEHSEAQSSPAVTLAAAALEDAVKAELRWLDREFTDVLTRRRETERKILLHRFEVTRLRRREQALLALGGIVAGVGLTEIWSAPSDIGGWLIAIVGVLILLLSLRLFD